MVSMFTSGYRSAHSLLTLFRYVANALFWKISFNLDAEADLTSYGLIASQDLPSELVYLKCRLGQESPNWRQNCRI